MENATVLFKLYKTQLQFGGKIDNFVVEPDGRGNGVITARTIEEQEAVESSPLFKKGLITVHNPVIHDDVSNPFNEMLTQDELYAVSLLTPEKRGIIADNVRQVLKYNRIDVQTAVEREMTIKAKVGDKPDIKSLMDVIDPVSEAETAQLLNETKDETKIDKVLAKEESAEEKAEREEEEKIARDEETRIEKEIEAAAQSVKDAQTPVTIADIQKQTAKKTAKKK